MARMTPRRRAPLALLGFAILPMFLAGCAAPLGPGYDLRRETLAVHYVDRAGAAAIDYSLRASAQNTGNQPLDMLRVQAPQRMEQEAELHGTESAQVSANTSGAGARSGSLPIRMDPPLGRRKSREIQFSYSVPVRGGTIFLEPEEWFPSFLPPRGLFAKSAPRSERTQADIYVPPGDRVLTSGRLRFVHSASGGAETEYAYEIRGDDFPPFLLVGRYQEQKVVARGRAVTFWTPEPVDSGCARTLAGDAVSAAEFYPGMFGLVGKARQPIRLIQIPGESFSSLAVSGDATRSIPFGVLFSQSPADACRQPDRFFYSAARSLAATWFGWAVRPQGDARSIMGGVQDYAALLAVEQQYGPQARRRQVAEWLAEYGRLSSHTRPLAPANLDASATLAQRRMAALQSALCFVALEDRFGSEPVKQGLRNLVGSLRGSDAGRNELRSALERQTGVDLYGFFNQWLGRRGIPSPFRQRYMAADSRSNLNADVNPPPRSER
jgi:hypothetical protein